MNDIAVLMAVGTACLCLVILVLGTMIGVMLGLVPVETIGTVEGAGVGGGLLGFAAVLLGVIKVAFGAGGK